MVAPNMLNRQSQTATRNEPLAWGIG